jgi:hypothetical protein
VYGGSPTSTSICPTINFLAGIIKRVCPTAPHLTWRELNEELKMKSAILALPVIVGLAGCAGDNRYVRCLPDFGLVGCMIRSGDQAYAPPSYSSVPAQIASAAPVRLTPPVRSVAIEYYDKQPLVRIGVSGYGSFRCVLDTGADDVVIPGRLIRWLFNAGLSDRDVQVIGEGRAQLAGGSTAPFLKIVLSNLTVGPWTLHNVPVSVVPGGDCLLGMSVLRVFGHPMIDFARQRLILED